MNGLLAAIAMVTLFAAGTARSMTLLPGNLVVGYESGLIAQFDSTGDTVDGFFSGFELRGLDVVANRQFVLVDRSSTVFRLSSGGTILDSFSIPIGFGFEESDVLAVGPTGDLFIQDETTVFVLDESGAFRDFFAVPGQGSAPEPAGLAVSGNGDIFAALYYYNDRGSQIFQLDSHGSVLASSDLIDGRIRGVALDPNGDIVFSTELVNASGWTIGVAISRLDRSGSIIDTLTLPNSRRPSGLATVTAPVPEPSTITLLILGLAVLSSWRQRQAGAV